MKFVRILVAITAPLLLLFLLAPLPIQALAEDILPDGCVGNLQDDQVVVYYFHRKFRCQSCGILESTLQNTVRTRYADQFGAGRLAMCVVNLDDPANRHYLDQFELFSNSVVIVRKKDGTVARFKNLESIWDVSEDSNAISHLLTTEVDRFLTGS